MYLLGSSAALHAAADKAAASGRSCMWSSVLERLESHGMLGKQLQVQPAGHWVVGIRATMAVAHQHALVCNLDWYDEQIEHHEHPQFRKQLPAISCLDSLVQVTAWCRWLLPPMGVSSMKRIGSPAQQMALPGLVIRPSAGMLPASQTGD